eukprot:CAMPEP_0204533898 /NCGR_PEP_ID=MMETSP0661-20131031/12557_1 /ASSEMBLY_ACC=CAM_ASM_000606 /TAXON_ID=109239 /ORGANISM="Alexandrium margalefi, Strain AMGDE01CS-322" /LENGTH=127 /DNA_ID=CAMNT_0051540303 /DNA_START=118 /DNA_END=501 /DNA_ORIENTATION=-
MALPMKTMKTMKAMKAMKAVMKKPGAKSMKTMKAMKAMKSKIARGRLSMAMVYKGRKEKTVGGLKASDITRNKYGKFVSKKRSASAKSNVWARAIAAARKALGLKGFVPINRGPEGKALYAKAKALL